MLFAFLLIVPFNNRFTRISSFERGLYFVALLCIAVALTAILVLISDLIFGTGAAVAMGIVAGSGVGGLWFGMPLRRRRAVDDSGGR